MAAAPTAVAAAPAVLSLDDGGFAAGDLATTDRPGVVRWQASGFVSPFEFKLGQVNAIHWTPAEKPVKPEGEYCFELSGRDVVFGSLAGLDETGAQFEIPRIGRLQMARSAIRRIYRWRDSADLIYLGPNGLSGWREAGRPAPQPRSRTCRLRGCGALVTTRMTRPRGRANLVDPPPAQPGWRDEAGQLLTEREGASIHGDFGIPARANIEFEVSWKKKPDFVFALGTSDEPESVKRAFRFEAWGGDLIVQRELEKEADLAVVQEIEAGPGRAHFQVYLDQENNRITIFSPAGKQLASLKVGAIKSPALSGVDITNIRGDLRLEWLRIVRWSGEPPREVQADQARIHRADGSIVYGQITRFDAARREFVVRSGSAETRIVPEIRSRACSYRAAATSRPGVCASFTRTARVTAAIWCEVEKDSLVLKVPGVGQPLSLPLKGLRSLVVLSAGEIDAPVKERVDRAARAPGRAAHWQAGRGQCQGGLELPGVAARLERDCEPDVAWGLRPDHLQRAAATGPAPAGLSIAGATAFLEAAGDNTTATATGPQGQEQGVGGMAVRFMSAMAEPIADSSTSSGKRRKAIDFLAGRRRDSLGHHQDR